MSPFAPFLLQGIAVAVDWIPNPIQVGSTPTYPAIFWRVMNIALLAASANMMRRKSGQVSASTEEDLYETVELRDIIGVSILGAILGILVGLLAVGGL
jgi:TRAP-type uncharacterized transport system fused permease subunit